MLKIKDGRLLNIGQLVEVYRNLNNQCFSIRDRKTKLVVAHVDGIAIKNAKCFVGKGRLKVLEEGRRNVHAYIIGEYVGEMDYDVSEMDEVYYNPFQLDSFVVNGIKVKYIDSVYFKNGKAYKIGGG